VLSSMAGMIACTNRLVAQRSVAASCELVELPLKALRVHVLTSLSQLMISNAATAGADSRDDALRPLWLALPAFAALSSIVHEAPETLFGTAGRLDLVLVCMNGLASRELARFDDVTLGTAGFGPCRMKILGYACRTLANAIIESQPRKAKVGAAGGAQAAVAAMRASNNAALQADGCMLLRNLMSATQRGSARMSAGAGLRGDAALGMAPDVVEAGGVELLHRALTLHPKDASVATAALGALMNFYNDAALSGGDQSRIPAALLASAAQPTKDTARRAARLHADNMQIVMTAQALLGLVDGGSGILTAPGSTETMRR